MHRAVLRSITSRLFSKQPCSQDTVAQSTMRAPFPETPYERVDRQTLSFK